MSARGSRVRERMPRRDARFFVLVVAIGLLSGFLAGLFGVGGGILMVPALTLLLGVEQRLAHGTSLTAIIPMALVGVTGYALGDSVDWAAALLLTLGAAGGTVLGTAALHRLPQRVLRLAFAAFLVVTAARMFFEVGAPGGAPHLDVATSALLVLTGIVSGITAGLFGVGGGLIMVPAMVLLLSLPDALAKGTSLAVIVPTALVGTYRNARVKNTDLPLAATLGLSGMVTAFAMSQWSVTMDARLSRVLFACLMLVVAAFMVFRKDTGAGAEPGFEP